MSNILVPAIRNWIPYNLKLKEGSYTCGWLDMNDKEYTEPFFAETILKCKSFTNNSKAERPLSDISILPEWAADVNVIEPTVFIFHISRCGSTLISQALGINDEHIVLAEVPFIDELLRLSDSNCWPGQTDPKTILKAAFGLYGQNRNGKKKHLFVKTDSWHIYFLPLLRQLYPDVPFVLLYRKPDEVIRSQQKKRGIQAIPGLISDHILGISSTEEFNLDMHMAGVISSFLTSFIRIAQEDKLTLPVNYNEGVENIVKRIAEFTGIELNGEDLYQIRQRSRFDAKEPDKVFAEETLVAAVPDYLQPAFELYDEMEKLRNAKVLAER